jgi:hypothetical protein
MRRPATTTKPAVVGVNGSEESLLAAEWAAMERFAMKSGRDNKGMQAGSVLVDLAASSLGGKVEGSVADQTVLTSDRVRIIGTPR